MLNLEVIRSPVCCSILANWAGTQRLQIAASLKSFFFICSPLVIAWVGTELQSPETIAFFILWLLFIGCVTAVFIHPGDYLTIWDWSGWVIHAICLIATKLKEERKKNSYNLSLGTAAFPLLRANSQPLKSSWSQSSTLTLTAMSWSRCCFSNGLNVVSITKSCLTLATPWTVACQGPPSMGFSRQEYWNGLPFSSPMFLM